jgi:hypothetical protein
LSYYIQQLNAALAATQAQRAKQRAERERDAARERLTTPLDQRLERLLSSIPIEIQHEGLSLASLQTSLRGRSRGNCHPGELGAALRKLGFKRERRWRDEVGFRALWYSSQ